MVHFLHSNSVRNLVPFPPLKGHSLFLFHSPISINPSMMSSSFIGDAIMDNQHPFLHCPPSSFTQPKSIEELRQTLVLAQMELETTRQRAEEELRNRDNQLTHLKFLLSQANLEKQHSSRTLQRLLSDKFILQHKIQQLQHHQLPGIGLELDRQQSEDEPRRRLEYNSSIISHNHNNGFSDSDESIVSSPVQEEEEDAVSRLVVDQPLPEKGKLLLAVMKAGPLLQTLMLAGPLPQWRHPPPPMDSYQIPAPPVEIPAIVTEVREHLFGKNDVRVMRKREVCGGGSDFGQNKHPRFVL